MIIRKYLFINGIELNNESEVIEFWYFWLNNFCSRPAPKSQGKINGSFTQFSVGIILMVYLRYNILNPKWVELLQRLFDLLSATKWIHVTPMLSHQVEFRPDLRVNTLYHAEFLKNRPKQDILLISGLRLRRFLSIVSKFLSKAATQFA